MDLQLPERIPDTADWLAIPRGVPFASPPPATGVEDGGNVGKDQEGAERAAAPAAVERFDLILRERGRRLATIPVPAHELEALLAALPEGAARRLRAALARFDASPRALVLADGRRLDLSGRKGPLLMGIVNVTPDSFSDGGRHFDARAAIDHARRLAEEGADILDIGGESTRPGAAEIPVDEELRRVLPVIEALAGDGLIVSVDTRKAAVMAAALDAGAAIVNDVSALTFDPHAMSVLAARDAPVVLMHAQGDPATMQQAPRYDDVLCEIWDFLDARIRVCERAGIARTRLIVDPGIGFGKTLAHNLTLLRDLAAFRQLGAPVLLGASRKRFIGAITGEPRADRRLAGSLAAAIAGWQAGAAILRVHDVAGTRQALMVARAIAIGA